MQPSPFPRQQPTVIAAQLAHAVSRASPRTDAIVSRNRVNTVRRVAGTNVVYTLATRPGGDSALRSELSIIGRLRRKSPDTFDYMDEALIAGQPALVQIAMRSCSELLPGNAVGQKEHARAVLRIAAAIGVQLCEIHRLSAAHGLGAVHGAVSYRTIAADCTVSAPAPPPHTWRLVGFSSAALLSHDHTRPVYPRPGIFDPPEASYGMIGAPTDIWGLGMTLLFLLSDAEERRRWGTNGAVLPTGPHDWLSRLLGPAYYQSVEAGAPAMSLTRAQSAYTGGRIDAICTGAPPGLRRLIKACLCAGVHRRPSAAQVVAMAQDALRGEGQHSDQ